jgi:hypothetical protein
MKTNNKINAYILCGSTAVLLFSCVIVALCSAINLPEQPPKAAAPQDNAAFGANGHQSRSLSFADRVAYQRAIEEVYWRHRIWPDTNAGPKPPLNKVMSQAEIEKKVTDYLRNSQVLEDYWQRPLTADQLQAEMERMASHTKQPEVLQELFEALGNDPFVIAECLARPVLTEHLIADLSAQHQTGRFESLRTAGLHSVSTATMLGQAAYTLPVIASPSGGCTDDTWTPTTLTNAPDPRWLHTAVWTGSEMIVWGGAGSLNTGGRYNPSTDSWTATSTTNAPTGRARHTAVWTGSEMIVWGGFGVAGYLNTGGRYNPSTNSWTATSNTGVPAAREDHTAVWTGSEMIVWGGIGAGPGGTEWFNTGGRYDPDSDSWTATNTADAPFGREFHTAVWADSEMIVWGGLDSNLNHTNTGGRYNPSTDSWTATSRTDAPAPREDHRAVWTDSEMIVWGGLDDIIGYSNTGGRYNPNTDSWIATSITGAPSVRAFHTAVWTDSEMIVWGGGPGPFNTGGRYDPVIDSWIATSTANAPSARRNHTAVWTGMASEMIVWGGCAGPTCESIFNTGGRYCAAAGGGPLTLESSFSRKTGRAGSFDVPLPGVEDRSDGKRFVIGFTFNNNVTGADSATTSCGTIGSVSVDSNDSHTLLVTFDGRTCNQQEVNITATNVHDDQGNTLASTETSGCFLIGDVNGDGRVNNGDIGSIQGHVGERTDSSNFRNDINADGRINDNDVLAARAHRRESCQ